ncbi:MAG TPA: hypothetical protein VMF90_10110 [Rhizobiaceae bacterium]|nr:hypothetical protein [Rhizobiaceae bacterium]
MFEYVGDAATWAASFVALGALALAIYERRGADLIAVENRELARQNAELQKKQHLLDQRAWTDAHFQSVREWAEQVSFALAEAIHLPASGADETKKIEILTKLSALIDTGRWYFPNQWSDEYGLDKEPAYRGTRQPILDCIVAAYDDLKDGGNSPDTRRNLTACQRHFVSQVQAVLDPRLRDQEISKVINEWKQSEKLRELPAKNVPAPTTSES